MSYAFRKSVMYSQATLDVVWFLNRKSVVLENQCVAHVRNAITFYLPAISTINYMNDGVCTLTGAGLAFYNWTSLLSDSHQVALTATISQSVLGL